MNDDQAEALRRVRAFAEAFDAHPGRSPLVREIYTDDETHDLLIADLLEVVHALLDLQDSKVTLADYLRWRAGEPASASPSVPERYTPRPGRVGAPEFDDVKPEVPTTRDAPLSHFRVVDLSPANVERAKARLRDALEGCESGEFRVVEHSETGLLSALLDDLRGGR